MLNIYPECTTTITAARWISRVEDWGFSVDIWGDMIYQVHTNLVLLLYELGLQS